MKLVILQQQFLPRLFLKAYHGRTSCYMQNHIDLRLIAVSLLQLIISEYYNNYTAPSFPPAWKTLEVVSFGTLSKLFCNFKDNSVKKKVAKEFLLPQYLYLENWIKCIAVLRNACAHHARIWNRRFPTMPIMPKYLPSQWVVTGNFRPNKLYHQLCCLAYLEQSIAANGSFSKRLLKLIYKSESVNTRSMGFPQEWKNEPLWIIKA